MPRQLNKDLFEAQLNLKPFEKMKNLSPELKVEDNSYRLNTMEKKIKGLNHHINQLESKIPKLEQLYKNLFEKNQSNIKRLETAVKSNIQTVLHKFSRLASKVNTKTLEQNRVQELIDRQNAVLQQYELRLNKMQKIISEQDLQLMNYKSTLQKLQKKHYL